MELICYANSFQIKDELRGHGFTYSSEVYGPHDESLGQAPRKGWKRVFQRETPGDPEDFQTVCAWIQQQGYEQYTTRFSARSLIDAVAEGRPDLLPEL